MGVGDDQLHAAKTPASEAAQEVGPEHLGFRRPDRHAQHLAPAVTADADRNGNRHQKNAAGLTCLQIGGVDPDVRPVAFDGTVEESHHTDVDLFTKPAAPLRGDRLWLFEIPLIPIALTRSSTERVEMPWI
jgi:hypothetical protein